ncbi:MAG TPA: bifunctional aspartate kinase/homoserine dehydrogenase I, partial [Mucilaginibacter sp.]|nr:bifunctional aspartate kinase/homoserine dehydrogenase I [Mucilaginibacter sp.]
MKILKFGGTSVGSAQSIGTMIEILKKEYQAGERPITVVSAMNGVTNSLLSMAEKASRGEEFTEALAELEVRHFDMVRTLLQVQHQNPAFTRLKINFNHLEELLQGVQTLRELTPKTRDLILSYGERCSTLMISKMAAQYFPEALFVDASDLIKTDSSFGNAKV